MNRNYAIGGLLIILLAVVFGIGIVLVQMQEDSKQKGKEMSAVQEVGGNTTKQQGPTSEIIKTQFQGEYERDGQTVVLSKDGEYYVVEEGYVLSGGVRVNAQGDRVSVYELEKRD